MTYQPDPLLHEVLADTASLYCSPDAEYCTEESPCTCDGAEEDVLPAKAEAVGGIVQYLGNMSMGDEVPLLLDNSIVVRLVHSGDAGVSGEKAG